MRQGGPLVELQEENGGVVALSRPSWGGFSRQSPWLEEEG